MKRGFLHYLDSAPQCDCITPPSLLSATGTFHQTEGHPVKRKSDFHPSDKKVNGYPRIECSDGISFRL
jgi:hypothetical protein